MTNTYSPLPAVHVKDGTVFANSKDVADYFGKQHKDVLASIRETCIPSLSAEISAQWFIPVKNEVRVGFGTRLDDAFDMTRDGFTLLVMGYTGKKAMEFKVRYIQRFNEMEEALKAQTPAIPQSFAEALRLAADQQEQIEKQKAQITEMKPKVAVGEVVASRARRLTDVAARLHGVNRNLLHHALASSGYLKRVDGAWRVRAYHRYQKSRRIADVLFRDRSCPTTGNNVIEVLPQGWEELVSLYLHGALPLRKGCTIRTPEDSLPN